MYRVFFTKVKNHLSQNGSAEMAAERSDAAIGSGGWAPVSSTNGLAGIKKRRRFLRMIIDSVAAAARASEFYERVTVCIVLHWFRLPNGFNGFYFLTVCINLHRFDPERRGWQRSEATLRKQTFVLFAKACPLFKPVSSINRRGWFAMWKNIFTQKGTKWLFLSLYSIGEIYRDKKRTLPVTL